MPPAPHSPSPPSHAALDLARRLFEREMDGESGEAAAPAAAERLCTRTFAGLSRWFGPYGSNALIARALARAQARHPALDGVTLESQPSSFCLAGLAEGAGRHGAALVGEGVVALLATLGDMMARLIGEDLAFSLLEQSATAPTESDTSTSAGSDAPASAAGTARGADDHSPDDHAPPDAGAAGDAHLTVNEP
jgi:hypothetical protein